MTRNPEHTEYGRCEATNRDGERCGRAAIGDHGKCSYHGGKAGAPEGEDNPAFKHGLFSDHLDEQDRETIDALERYDDAEKMNELINWRLARLRRYVREMNDEDAEHFYEALQRMIAAGERNGEPGLSAKQIKELGKTLNRNNQALQREIDLVRKLIKDRNKIAEGEDHNVTLTDVLLGNE